jgi:DNA-directed RNA polymerase specialized sigma subunit
MAPVKTYKVTAKRWAHGWELHIDKVGVTQSRNLAEADRMVRDYLALEYDTDPSAFNIDITPQVGGDLDARAAHAKDRTRAAIQAQTEAAEEARQVARALKSHGLTGRDIAAVLDVSPQRVSQLVAG